MLESDSEWSCSGIGRRMGDYVLESNPALERLMERLHAQGEPYDDHIVDEHRRIVDDDREPVDDGPEVHDENRPGGSDWVLNAFEVWKREAIEDDVVQDVEDLEAVDDDESDAYEFIDVFDDNTEVPVHAAEPAYEQYVVPATLLEPTVEPNEPCHLAPSALSSQFSGNAGRKKARHKKQSPKQRKRSLKEAEHRLELLFLDQMSFIGLTTKQWRLMASPDLFRVSAAERRFAVSLGHSKAAMLAAADELDAATRDATTWLTTHPCPDLNLGDQVALFVNTCAEVAVTSRSSVASPPADQLSVMSRLGGLLSVIDHQVRAMDSW
jgi:hypothetical protein